MCLAMDPRNRPSTVILRHRLRPRCAAHAADYLLSLKCCDVSTCGPGAAASLDDETTEENSSTTQSATVAPTAAKPYAHPNRVHGQVRGSRQRRPNESSSSFRKSSVIGFGATALHNSHKSHAATAISNTPHHTLNATLSAPALKATRSHGCATGGAA